MKGEKILSFVVKVVCVLARHLIMYFLRHMFSNNVCLPKQLEIL